MTPEKKQQIAASFSEQFESFDLSILLTEKEFHLFEKGIYANSMDAKWNIFIYDNWIFWARSWTGFCIFRIGFRRENSGALLEKGYVTRNKQEFNSDIIEKDKVLFLKLLQAYLDRDDIYSDPELELDLIKQTILQYDSGGLYKKSVGNNTAGLTRHIYNGLTTDDQGLYITVTGWSELRKNIADIPDDEPLLSVHLSNKTTNDAITYYFNHAGTVLLGQTVTKAREETDEPTQGKDVDISQFTVLGLIKKFLKK